MTPSLPAPRAIIFDWDNTLVDSWACIRDAMNATLVPMGHEPWNLDETRRRVALSLRNAFPALFGDRWEEARDLFYREFAAIHMDRLRPLPGASEMLEALATLGVRLAVVSNKNGAFLRKEAEHLGWAGLFDRLVGASDASADKPAAAPVILALQPSGVAPGTGVWFAGDAPIDMECALNAGCLPILLRNAPPAPGEFVNCPPRHHFARFEAVTGLVRELLRPISPI